MIRWPALLLLTTAVFHAQANPPAPDDFASGFALEVDGAHAIYRAELPDAVSAGVTRADLGDLRVFNAAGEAVPHSLRQILDDVSVSRTAVTLPIFPLEAVERATGATTALSVTTSPEGAVLHMDSTPATTADRYVTHYLVDASQLDKPIDRLEFHWQGDKGDFVTEIDVASSSDLSQWNTLRNKASLARLVFQGHVLEQNGVAITIPAKTYLRVTWPAGRDGVVLTQVTAYMTERAQTLSRQWSTLLGSKADSKPLAYEFTRPAHSGVDRVNLELPAHNILIEATLSSRGAADRPWQPRYRGLFYRLKIGAHELGNTEIPIAPTSDREWRLEIHSDASGLEHQSPQLMLGTRPQALYFLARGEAPFILAFGSAVISAAHAPVDALLASVQQGRQAELVGTARIANRVTLGGDTRLRPPSPPLPWKQWLLWGVLIAGVAVLAVMALRLHRQMRA